MEWIFIGIMIAIGFYFAPLIIGAIVAVIVAVFALIGFVFNALFKGGTR